MEHGEQVRLLKELMAHLDNDTNVDAGGFRRNPISVYTDPDMAAAEWDVMYRGFPQVVGLTGDLPEPGDFITTTDFGAPVLVTRGRDGVVRAFLNVCRHRGAVVEPRRSGHAARFTCPFHAWSYDDQGTLVGLPKPHHFGDFDRAEHALVELPAAERHGFVWVHPDPDGDLDPADLLGPDLDAEWASWRWDTYRPVGTDTYAMDLNWKLAMDTFGETYHFPSLHRDTLNTFFYGNVQCYDTFGRNHRMILCQQAIDSLRPLPTDDWDITVGAFPVYYLYPNVQVNVGYQSAIIVRVYPVPGNPGASVSRVGFYLAPERFAEVAATDGEPDKSGPELFGAIIRDEDYAVAETIQAAAGSGAQDTVLFGRNEPALHHYHNTYRAALGLDPLPLLG